MSSYYQLIDKKSDENGIITAHYCSTPHAQGAWNPHEQHMGPVSGVMVAELESAPNRADMRFARFSFDIFGLIPAGDFSITTRILRPGRTIELWEATLEAKNKVCVVCRAWRMVITDSSEIAELEDQTTEHQPHTLAPWNGMDHWPGGFIQGITSKAAPNHRLGKGLVWLHTDKTLIANQPCGDLAHLMGLVDTANGVAPRQEGERITWAFPNIDLQIHLYRRPKGQWLGLETVQQYGTDGIGLTSSVLHDLEGPFGRSEQILTLRKLPADT